MYAGLATVTALFAFCFYRMCIKDSDGYFYGCAFFMLCDVALVFMSIMRYQDGTLTGPLVTLYGIPAVVISHVSTFMQTTVTSVQTFLSSAPIEYICTGIIFCAFLVCIAGVCKGLRNTD